MKRAAQPFVLSHRRKAWNEDAAKTLTFDTNKIKDLASSIGSYYNQDEYLRKGSKFSESSREEGEDDECSKTWAVKVRGGIARTVRV